MSSEITVRASLQIKKGNLQYNSLPSGFTADMNGTYGPIPGQIIASIHGTNVDLSALVTPGLCRMQNLDAVNSVQYGITDLNTNVFYPLGELLPGESYVLRLSPHLQKDVPGTGTGSAGTGSTRLTFKAFKASCEVLLEAFQA